jgi:signal transduction histidine kinase
MATDGAGRIWMSLGKSLVMADPAQLRQPSAPTLIRFEQVSADELSLPLGETVSVPARPARTTIRFVGLNLAAPDRVRFRYKLAGVESHWSNISSVGEASYTNLSPGTHRFEVQASNIDGQWNGSSAGIELNVKPAFWQTLWFQVSTACLIFALGFCAYQWRLRVVERQWSLRFQERLDERTRIARDLHDTLLQSFHGLLLRFQAVRDLLLEEPVAAHEALGSVIDRAAEAITEGRDAVQALRGEEEYDNLGESLATIDREFRSAAESSQHSESEARYRVLIEGTPRRMHPVVQDELYRIALEAVRNAFRHARASEIELDIRYDDSSFRLRVRDDGAGIDPQLLTSGRRQGHYGLPGMRERATSIGGHFEIWSQLGRGTEIEITVPGKIVYGRFDDIENAHFH